MSKVSIGILFAAIALIILAVAFNVTFVAGGSGVVLVVSLAYSYVVAKREVKLLSYAMESRGPGRSNAPQTVTAEQPAM